jgi:transposase
MGQKRRQFTDEFKREAVALLASSGRPLIQIAAELGIAPSMLRNWRGRVTGLLRGLQAPRSNGIPPAHPKGRQTPRIRA